MKRFSLAVTIAAGLVLTAACSKKPADQTAQNVPPPAESAPATQPATPAPAPADQGPQAAATPAGETTPDAAMPNELPAEVTLTDGSKYRGTLQSKNGTQLTFLGENGATRTFDSRDVKSIRFLNKNEPEPTAKREHRRREAPAQAAQSTAPAPAPGPAPAAPAQTAESTPPPTPAPPPEIVIPAGTQISVRNNEAIDSKTATTGQRFSAVISQSVTDDSGQVAIPRGAPATLVIRQASAGKIKSNDLVLDLQSISVGGQQYEVEASDLAQKGRSGVGGNKRTATFLGGGGALGAIIGAVAGGGKGAAIGALSGAAAGAGTQVLTRGSVKVPSETVMTFKLTAPLRLQSQR